MGRRIVIIGGSDAGISAALRARQVAPDADVEVVVADAYPNYSVCGMPFFLSGEVARSEALAHRTAHAIEGGVVSVDGEPHGVMGAPRARAGAQLLRRRGR